ncbi:DNA-binding response regulator, OmpR family, contains REC and winged-helix (wHTH) domain [Seinonella peptonophila]|uniref:DNA-binding response regulator, OmpR family, contains REC and winged-helix (WHTH) domain n=2 Tax=Seinonella peptonophila TaxID=112248 RepID=A0A1M4XVY0_9BACL|nr:DNA-binding response regulator, OmpR family, contains REC and winged-helix (wHTH) domain [Seinonella peptonophila]
MRKKILIVDDDAEIREIIHIYLQNENYQVFEAEDGISALTQLQKEKIDCVVLDIMMPGINGIETCLKIRQQKRIPIIILSAKSEDMDKINGLSVGADDYMVKPFNPLELVARIKAQLRRQDFFQQSSQNFSEIRVNDLIIDKNKHVVKVEGREVSLTPIEFSILELLASQRGQVFSTEQIYQQVWNETSAYYSRNTIMVHIRNLREKIEVNPRKPEYIKTVWGVGYKIED